jgi:hypothetical protein
MSLEDTITIDRSGKTFKVHWVLSPEVIELVNSVDGFSYRPDLIEAINKYLGKAMRTTDIPYEGESIQLYGMKVAYHNPGFISTGIACRDVSCDSSIVVPFKRLLRKRDFGSITFAYGVQIPQEHPYLEPSMN